MTAVRTYMWDMAGEGGIILCGRQFMNSLAESSLDEVKAAINSEPWLMPHFEIGEKYIATKSGRLSYAFSGLDRNIDSIKSKSRIRLAWVDEAEPVTEEAWVKLIPTLREEDSELWVTWNPELEHSATNKRFYKSKAPRTKIVEMNYRDNPWFPAILERKRLQDLEERPDQYEHIWEGAFRAVMEGSYYARYLTVAKNDNRIGAFPAVPLLMRRAFVDVGGTGKASDAFTIWVAQFVKGEIRIFDYYEVVGQELTDHLTWLRSRGYVPGNTTIYLPHDGAQHDKVYRVSYQSGFEDAGYDVEVIERKDGAAMLRIEAARRNFHRMKFNEATTEMGRKALGWYHEKLDPDRNIGLGPEHDWASHGADAFGLMAVVYEEEPANKKLPQISNAFQASA